MTADLGRAQVYAAELAAFDGTDLEDVVGVGKVAAAIRAVVETSWWPGRDVTVREMRSDARSSATRCALDGADAADIGLAATQATIATGAHELAHVLAGVGHGHDATFRRAHLDVVFAMTNTDRATGRGELHADQLGLAYGAAGLAVADRNWPKPPPVGGPIAL